MTERAEDIDQPTEPAPYVALVHVHGMGSQKRFEELSHLIDSLDQRSQDGQPAGRIRKIRLGLEQGRSGLTRDVGFVTAMRRLGTTQRFRFYEAYWAHVTAEGVPARDVATWMMSNIPRPIRVLRANWRTFPRIRRAILLKHWPTLRTRVAGTVDSDLKSLLKIHDDFEGWDARREFEEGTAKQFAQYVENRSSSDPARQQRLGALARAWQGLYVFSELRALFLLATIGLSLLLSAALALWGVFELLTWAAATLAFPFRELAFDADLKTAGMLLTAVLPLTGITAFLKTYMGDVQLWSTYEETSEKHKKRREILDLCCATLAHVLNDRNCTRVVILAHSLGTTVALDTLLELARRNRAANPDNPHHGPIRFDKISHLVTCGSPIDKVHYFFESHAGKYHRYNRVIEELRGDIGTPPFSINGWPLLHWINFWDRADIISAPLYRRRSIRPQATSIRTWRLTTSRSASLGFRILPARIPLTSTSRVSLRWCSRRCSTGSTPIRLLDRTTRFSPAWDRAAGGRRRVSSNGSQ